MPGWQGANEGANWAFVTEEQRRQASLDLLERLELVERRRIPAEDCFTNACCSPLVWCV